MCIYLCATLCSKILLDVFSEVKPIRDVNMPKVLNISSAKIYDLVRSKYER
jgi:hypothetical protein